MTPVPSSAHLLEDRSKTGLLEMVICRQGLKQPALGHRREGNTVRQGPGFVRPSSEQVEAGPVYSLLIPDDVEKWVREQL